MAMAVTVRCKRFHSISDQIGDRIGEPKGVTEKYPTVITNGF